MFSLPFTEFDILKKEDGSSGLTVREFDIIFTLHKSTKDLSEVKIAKTIMAPIDHVKNDLEKLLSKKFIIETSKRTFICTKRGELLATALEYYNKYAELLILEEFNNRDIVEEYRQKFKD